MLENIIAYFAKRHFFANLFFLAIFIGGIFCWHHTSKEEMPDITFNRISITVRYPGAPASDVEYFVTDPIEEALLGVDGIYRITSSSSVGSSSVSVEIEQGVEDLDEVLTEIRNEVLDVDLPDDIIDDPSIRIFKTSKKAILDVALYIKDKHILDVQSRQYLQKYALTLEDQLINRKEINSVNRKGFWQEELQIKIDPAKLVSYDLPLSTVQKEIKNNHIRKPAGTIEALKEPKVTLLSELDTVERLNELIVQGGFEGGVIKLKEVADVTEGFEKETAIYKVNGHQAIMFNVVKNSSYGIIEALDAVEKVLEKFKKHNLSNTNIEIAVLDDESVDIRNRLSLIGYNSLIGFILVMVALLFFLNLQSALWVAVGIPFTFCLTMICASFLGYTINGTTLSAVIIVMGIIVDDAIVVAENITRRINQGESVAEAVVRGTEFVLLPIVASIVTTCVAFIPLFFFKGHFGNFVYFIPPIIFLMLGASFLESIFILPGHMSLKIPFLKNFESRGKGHWFDKVEQYYENLLKKVLPYRMWVFVGFVLLALFSFYVLKHKMKFVMFPKEETREIVLQGTTQKGSTRFETADATKKIEDALLEYQGKEVIGYRTEIARSRRGKAVEENKFRVVVEIVPKEKRNKSADMLVKEFKNKINEDDFAEIKFLKSRWGHSSGSPIEVIVQQNDDKLREQSVKALIEKMKQYKVLDNIEEDEGFYVPEYRLSIKQEKVKRLDIDSTTIASTLRSALEGSVLYEFQRGDQDINVRLTTVTEAKDNIDKILLVPIENKGKYLVPLNDVVSVKEVQSPNSIYRQDLKRTTLIFADISKKNKKTPLEIASYMEENIFPEILAAFPTTTLSFGGEVLDTRESKDNFRNAVLMALFFIYLILAVLFQSLLRPLAIMLSIPFGVVGVILAFIIHGKIVFGFFAAVGILGLAGVVVNDSIIMLVKLDDEYSAEGKEQSFKQIASIAKTRLRAVVLTTLTTVAGILPAAYGIGGYDATLAEMMLALAWGLVFGTLITLFLIPCIYSVEKDVSRVLKRGEAN